MLHRGAVPPLLGGGIQMNNGDQADAMSAVSLDLGHNRQRVLCAYTGSFEQRETNVPMQISTLYENLQSTKLSGLPPVPPEKAEDCAKVVMEMEMAGPEMSMRQVYAIWLRWSARCGVPWMRPGTAVLPGVLAGLQSLESEAVQ
jgi:hypothetical protein